MGTTIKLSNKPLVQWNCADLRRDYMWINNTRPFNNNGAMTNDVREMLKSVGLSHLESKYTSLMILRTPEKDHEAIWGFSGSPVAEGLMADLIYTEIPDVTLDCGAGKYYKETGLKANLRKGHAGLKTPHVIRINISISKKYFDIPLSIINVTNYANFSAVLIPGWWYKLFFTELIEPCLIKPTKKKA